MLGLSQEELASILKDIGEKPFRAAQLQEWLNLGTSFEDMTNLSKSLRSTLRERFDEGYPKIREKLVSVDGTQKYLFELNDGALVETVFMSYEHGNTVCISSQVGCAMACAFCASGKNGLVRNLTVGELLGQVIMVNRDAGRVSNIVVMGIGEPFSNYENMMGFLRAVNDKKGLNIGWRSISLSTCGLVPEIKRFTQEGMHITLCLSLHAPTDEKRARLMPIASSFSLDETVGACIQYTKKTGRRLIIEYIVLAGFNDTMQDAEALRFLLKNTIAHINLIPCNSIEGGEFKAPTKSEVYAFLAKLTDLGLSATVRRSLGRDIAGACGQLRAKYG